MAKVTLTNLLKVSWQPKWPYPIWWRCVSWHSQCDLNQLADGEWADTRWPTAPCWKWVSWHSQGDLRWLDYGEGPIWIFLRIVHFVIIWYQWPIRTTHSVFNTWICFWFVNIVMNIVRKKDVNNCCFLLKIGELLSHWIARCSPWMFSVLWVWLHCHPHNDFCIKM